jgi:hypothetical protein
MPFFDSSVRIELTTSRMSTWVRVIIFIAQQNLQDQVITVIKFFCILINPKLSDIILS